MPKRTPAQLEQLFWSQVRKSDGCWLWTGYINSRGYGAFRRKGTAHRFALEQALGRPLASGMGALHVCDNPACVRNDDAGWYEVDGIRRLRRGHLWEGTTQENTADREAKGRGAKVNGSVLYPERLSRGTNRYNAKFTDDQIRAIRQAAADGVRQVDLAAKYGVGTTTIHHIVHRENWKHVA